MDRGAFEGGARGHLLRLRLPHRMRDGGDAAQSRLRRSLHGWWALRLEGHEGDGEAFRQRRFVVTGRLSMALETRGIIAIPNSSQTSYDHGAFDPKSRRVFVAHTGRDCVEVIDHDTRRHVATLDGFPEAAGVVAVDGDVLITNRGAAGLAWLDATTLKTRFVSATAARPNGVAMTSSANLAVAACIGDDTHEPELQVFNLDGSRRATLKLPGRPRWCVVDAD